MLMISVGIHARKERTVRCLNARVSLSVMLKSPWDHRPTGHKRILIEIITASGWPWGLCGGRARGRRPGGRRLVATQGFVHEIWCIRGARDPHDTLPGQLSVPHPYASSTAKDN